MQQNKQGESRQLKFHVKTMMHKNRKNSKTNTQHVPFRQNTEEREHGKDPKVVRRLERMKHGNDIKDRDDRSSGTEILIPDAFVKVNPTDPLR